MNSEDRYTLQSLLNQVATRRQLVDNFNLPSWFVYKSPLMPKPVVTVGTGDQRPWALFDYGEVIAIYKKHHRICRPWTQSEVQKLMRLRKEKWDLSWVKLAHYFPGRTVDSIRTKYHWELGRNT